MKKLILSVIFFLGFMFVNLNYANAVEVCPSNQSYAPGQSVQCGLPNFCTGCDAYNYVVQCVADSSGHLPATINFSTCTYVTTATHQINAPECASSCATPAPVCPTIPCFGNSGAGGTCGYGIQGSPPRGGDNVDIGSCQSDKCPGGPVPGHTISVCQSTNCYYNSCECWPNAACPTPTPPTPPATPAPTPTAAPIFTSAPAFVCPFPTQVNNIHVTCPFCL